jgi:hypothetical protein
VRITGGHGPRVCCAVARCQVDSSIQRVTAGAFAFPLGVYPVEALTPVSGYTLTFESADGGDDDGPEPGDRAEPELDLPDPPDRAGRADLDDRDAPDRPRGAGGNRRGLGTGGGAGEADESDLEDLDDGPGAEGFEGDGEGGWTHWPDRYVFDINISASRVEALCRQLFALLPGRVYPILDVMGNDAYREIDPYIAYDLVGLERFQDGLRRFRAWFFEDGTVGFGAMSEEPFFYVFVDEHKIVTVRAEAHMKERVERVLAAFDLKEVDKIAGVDAAVHEHRTVLDAPRDRPDLLTHDEVLEEVRDLWSLTLNLDPLKNTDDDGADLGVTLWRCVVRVFSEQGDVRYAEVLCSADCLQTAGDLSMSAVEQMDPALSPDTPPDDQEPSDFDVLTADRVREDDLRTMLGAQAGTVTIDTGGSAVIAARWM